MMYDLLFQFCDQLLAMIDRAVTAFEKWVDHAIQ